MQATAVPLRANQSSSRQLRFCKVTVGANALVRVPYWRFRQRLGKLRGEGSALGRGIMRYPKRVLFHNSQPHPIAENTNTAPSTDVQKTSIANGGTCV